MIQDVQRYYRAVAPFIDREIGNHGQRFWARIAAEHRGAQVLELGAGTGRVTEALAIQAAEVVAVDLSLDMLRHARQRLARYDNVRLVAADMRRLVFRRRFGLVVCADADCHLLGDADRAAMLRLVAEHLAPEGRFILGAMWLPPDEARAAAMGQRVREYRTEAAGEPLRVREQWRCNRRSRRCTVRYEYRTPGHRPVVAEYEARYWSPDELRTQLARAGLAVQALWGDYDGAPWDPRRSPSLLVSARLAAAREAAG